MKEKDIYIHPTAVVDQACQIGEGSRIWHFCHLMPEVRLGEDCSLGQNVFVGRGVILGNNVKVQNNVSLYEGVECEDDVFLGPSMVFTNIRNPRSAIIRKGQYEKTLVRKGATIGANATVVCGIEIGAYAFIGAGAVVTRSVPDYALMLGSPARITGWMSAFGHRLHFDEDAWAQCPESKVWYRLVQGEVKPVNRKE